MRLPAIKTLALTLLSLTVAALVSLRWCSIIVAQASTDNELFLTGATAERVVTVLLAVALLSVWMLWRREAVLVGAAVLAAFASLWIMQYTTTALLRVYYQALFIIVIASASVAAVAVLRRRASLAALSLLCILNVVPHAMPLLTAHQAPRSTAISVALGDPAAVAAAALSVPPGHYHWTVLLLLACAFCATAFTAWALLSERNALHWLARGVAGGLLLGPWLILSQLTLFAATLITGYNLPITVFLYLVVQATVTAATCLAVNAITGKSRYTLAKMAPVVPVALLSALLAVAFYGTREFNHLDSFHSDSTWAYIHYDASGAWRRTLDHSPSPIRLWHARRFIETYPCSVYRAAALLKLADYYFDEWQFDNASATLARVEEDYPCLRSRARITRSMMDLARGHGSTLLQVLPHAPHFDSWRRSQGSQLAAFAALRGNQPSKSLGYFNYYINYLKRRQPASWIQSSLAFAGLNADRAMERQREDIDRAENSTVTVSISAGGRPVRGGRIVLVQPHFDAALPADSRQFSGAWSIPAWNGHCGVTNEEGVARLTDIPPGDYEVVVGLNYRICSAGYVISHPVKPLALGAGDTEHVDIDLVPAVTLESPRNGDVVTKRPVLRWREYPGAATYAASIMSISRSARPGSGVALASSQKTCWARAGITGRRTSVDPAFFLGDTTALDSGQLYMCVVYAYGPDGVMLSSSEHYFNIRETVFTVHH